MENITVNKPELCNYKHWGKVKVWSMTESACILTGSEPGKATAEAKSMYQKMKSSRDADKQSLRRYSVNKGKSFFLKSRVLDWANANGIVLPDELQSLSTSITATVPIAPIAQPNKPQIKQQVICNKLEVYTVKQFAAMQTIFTEAALRNLIFKAKPRKSTLGDVPTNGLIECGAIIRNPHNRKVLINPTIFSNWVCNNGGV